MPGKAFDTNVLIYAYTSDPKAFLARERMRGGGTISVQNLNEFANVARRKLGYSWDDVTRAIDELVALFGPPVPLDHQVHLKGRELAERYALSLYDALIVAVALHAGCDTLYTEDMHDGLVIEGLLRLTNPFTAH